MPGYHKPLYILPFDHRTFLARNLFGTATPTPEEKEKIAHYKKVIYEGFLLSLEQGIPRDEGAVLVDEEYGLPILEDARKRGLVTAASAEKSGAENFEFAYGDDFREHLRRVRPTFAKALVHADSAGEIRSEDILKLRELSVFCRNEDIRFLLEPLTPVPPEERAAVLEHLINSLYRHGVEPDVWKIEGTANRADYERIVAAARGGGHDEVGVIVLGRGEDISVVHSWLKAASNTPGMIGFAVGRSIFWESIAALHHGKLSEKDASQKIADNFLSCYRIFVGENQ